MDGKPRLILLARPVAATKFEDSAGATSLTLASKVDIILPPICDGNFAPFLARGSSGALFEFASKAFPG